MVGGGSKQVGKSSIIICSIVVGYVVNKDDYPSNMYI